jgi:uncharacterized protein YodC (DUF2158 family)
LPRTNENYLRWQLGRWARDYAPNVKMLEVEGPPDVQLPAGEHAIALVGLASGAPPLVVTDTRLMQADQTLLRHGSVRHCHWIDRDGEAAATMKHSHSQRLILGLEDGREVVLDGLGQAVFPLLKFYWFKLGRGERRDNPPMHRTRPAV